MLNMGLVSKKRFGHMTEYLCVKYTPPGFVQVSESYFFFQGISCMGTSPGRVCANINLRKKSGSHGLMVRESDS